MLSNFTGLDPTGNWSLFVADQSAGAQSTLQSWSLTDILRVATAIHLGSEQFLTFDANQKRLAGAEGMVAPRP